MKEIRDEIEKVAPGAKYFAVEKSPRATHNATTSRNALRQGGWRGMKPTLKKRMMFVKTKMRGWHSLALEDLPVVFEWGAKVGLVRIGERHFRAKDGFVIGDPAAAGGRGEGPRAEQVPPGERGLKR